MDNPVQAMDTAQFERMLLSRKDEVERRLKRIDLDLGTLKSADSAERATEMENDEVLEEFGQVGEEELRAIDAALDRISKGRYAQCVECGELISMDRLKAVPHTPFCKDCAASH